MSVVTPALYLVCVFSEGKRFRVCNMLDVEIKWIMVGIIFIRVNRNWFILIHFRNIVTILLIVVIVKIIIIF